MPDHYCMVHYQLLFILYSKLFLFCCLSSLFVYCNAVAWLIWKHWLWFYSTFFNHPLVQSYCYYCCICKVPFYFYKTVLNSIKVHTIPNFHIDTIQWDPSRQLAEPNAELLYVLETVSVSSNITDHLAPPTIHHAICNGMIALCIHMPYGHNTHYSSMLDTNSTLAQQIAWEGIIIH